MSLPLAMVPVFVAGPLGHGDVVVGLAVGIHFLATILTRSYTGRVADRDGGRPVMMRGLRTCALSASLLALCAWLPLPAVAQLGALLASRLVLGYGESQLVTGMMAWAIGTAGPARAGKVMAWTGMAIYGGLAAGAPLGLWLYGWAGAVAVGAAGVALPGLAWACVRHVAPVAAVGGARTSFKQVLGQVWGPGVGLALQGVGFAAIGAFVALDFQAKGWGGAGLALMAFGGAFALVRLVAGHLPDRLGGARVAAGAMAIEAAGLLLLGFAPSAPLALLGAAVAGAGSSLVFPALGLVVVKATDAKNRATALGTYSAFQDVAYGLTGPVAGLLTQAHGYSAAFLAGALAAVGGSGVALALWRRAARPVRR